MGIVKTVIRIGVVGGLATGAAVLVAGPERVFALAGQARQAVVTRIDQNIKDPVALRAQLRSLEAEYPRRIAAVRADLAELQQQLAELDRDREVSVRVVEMASADLSELKAMLARAESARAESPLAVIQVRFDNRAYSLDQAYGRATQINNTLNVYGTRAADAERDIAFLRQQEERLSEVLAQLETERAQFQAQIWQLDGQIEMIARNEKLIELVEKRQASIDRHSRYEAVSLEQVTQRMARIRADQEARLQAVSGQTATTNYEKKARVMLDSENTARDVFKRSQEAAPAPTPTKAIEILPGASKQGEPAAAAPDKMARARTLIVE
jgi:chromosome segregation ATPase